MCERGLTSRVGDAVRVNEVDKDAVERVNVDLQIAVDDDQFKPKLVIRTDIVDRAVHRGHAQHSNLIDLHPHFSSSLPFY